MERLRIDGSEGEGGGQILRTALSLSAATGRAFELLNVRAGRRKPGLAAQHLASARAAAALCDALLEGDEIGSTKLAFEPRRAVAAGEKKFSIGTAGAAPLVLQTVATPLALAAGASAWRIEGGTHVPSAPTFHDLAFGWAPLLRHCGWPVDVRLLRGGFHPEGGGAIALRVSRASEARPLDLRRRGTLREVIAVPIVCGVDANIGARMGASARRRLREGGIDAEVEGISLPRGPSSGAAIVIRAVYENLTTTFSALGEQGIPAEATARRAVAEFEAHHLSGMALDPHLADQILLPLALASAGLQGGPTPIHRFSTSKITRHLTTNARVLRRFLPIEVAIFGREGEPGEIRVAPEGLGEVLPLLRSAAE